MSEPSFEIKLSIDGDEVEFGHAGSYYYEGEEAGSASYVCTYSERWVKIGRLRTPRWVQRIIARLGGFFWVPCPRCGREFGGHEHAVGPFSSLLNEDGSGQTCCRVCTEAEQRRHGITVRSGKRPPVIQDQGGTDV